ncbi:VOC family protein [Caulobacter sp. 17J80-11]|uniref:VOC family protein n=1 Tax=Caulobacter sp. 17J80-11 TaxID=2763502 RepID=UPI0016537B8B|nr:VOC family protein [Caulobacter sp. 17J80-11]MBC6982193.1 VOC family protein [Caulobacter sp. 17J80-11]
MQQIHPFLWFEGQAEEAMNFYVSIFPNSKVIKVMRYGDAGPGPKGAVMLCVFELDGQVFNALNGRPAGFGFSDAVSFTVNCETQAEVDRFWDALVAGGGQHSQCGWLRDKFGVAWQVTPIQIRDTVGGDDPAGARRAMEAMMQMTKLDIAKLEKAYAGE